MHPANKARLFGCTAQKQIPVSEMEVLNVRARMRVAVRLVGC